MKRNTFLLMMTFLVVSSVQTFGQLREYPDESLRGVIGVRVVVKYQGPAEGSSGLNQKQLQDAVEERLKMDNVKVLSTEEWKHELGRPYFNINIIGVQVGSEKTPTFFYTIATDFIQEVTLRRRPSLKTEGSTWNQDYNLVVTKDSLREVTLKIDAVAHDFAQSVLEANK